MADFSGYSRVGYICSFRDMVMEETLSESKPIPFSEAKAQVDAVNRRRKAEKDKKTERAERSVAHYNPSTKVYSKITTVNYAEGWDRIFGKKEPDEANDSHVEELEVPF